MKFKVKQGENVFKWHGIQLPNIPTFGRKRMVYKVKLAPEWFDGIPLTQPPGFGVKLPAIGKLNYHNSGANFAIVKEGRQLITYPRYYENKNLVQLRDHEEFIDGSTDMYEMYQIKGYDQLDKISSLQWFETDSIITNVRYLPKCRWYTITSGIGTTWSEELQSRVVATKDLTIEIKFRLFGRIWI